MIEIRNVYKTYPSGVEALKGVSLKIEKGEFVFLVGPSGSGKSTLLKLLLKEEDSESGIIRVGKYEPTSMRRGKIPYLRRGIGIVFQDFRLLPDRTVYENVAFAMHIVEALPKDIRRQVPMLLALVGLSSKANHYPHELSGGEQQRVALARALANNPSVLLADEPTGNLDPETSLDIIKLISDINHRGTTVLIATHAREIVDVMKKRVVVLDSGRIVSDQEKGVYSVETENVQIPH
ncbi:MAG: cell division ATP-binding protein FtsE [Ignavibacteriales bacterium]